MRFNNYCIRTCVTSGSEFSLETTALDNGKRKDKTIKPCCNYVVSTEKWRSCRGLFQVLFCIRLKSYEWTSSRLFNESVRNRSSSPASNGMNGWQRSMNLKAVGRIQSWPIVRYCLRIRYSSWWTAETHEKTPVGVQPRLKNLSPHPTRRQKRYSLSQTGRQENFYGKYATRSPAKSQSGFGTTCVYYVETLLQSDSQRLILANSGEGGGGEGQ